LDVVAVAEHGAIAGNAVTVDCPGVCPFGKKIMKRFLTPSEPATAAVVAPTFVSVV